MISGEQVAE